jgi:hypothetical protein
MPIFTRQSTRLLLAAIRIFNGTLALTAPQRIVRQFESDPDVPPPPVAVYALRMFGIRTILIGLDLLRNDQQRSHAVRVAPIIHASDLLTAVLVARSAGIAPRTRAMIVSISAFNTLLSLLMREPDAEEAPVEASQSSTESETAVT